MKSFDQYSLLMTPLSPIHVGTGEYFEPTNYVIKDEILYAFDTHALESALNLKARQNLLSIASRKPDDKMINALQNFFYEHRDQLIAHAHQHLPVLPGINTLYSNRIGQTANREALGGNVVNKLEIDRTSNNPITRLPILFGSSLKGAIRTAILNQCHTTRPALPQPTKQHKQLEQKLLENPSAHFECDPLRLIHLADAPWNNRDGLPATLIQMAVNRKKSPVKDDTGLLRKATADNLYQLLECLPAWRYRALTGQLMVQTLAGLGDQQRTDTPNLRLSARDIVRACNDFYRPILGAEIDLLRSRQYHDQKWIKAIQQLLSQSAQAMQNGQVFLLRVGRHSGAESVTIKGQRKIKVNAGKNQHPQYLDSAKTLWLAANDQDQTQNLLPFGWLLVEMHNPDDPPKDWQDLEQACRPFCEEGKKMAERIKTQQIDMENLRQQAEQQQREESEALQQQAQAEAQVAREESERRAQRATMTETERTLQDFIDYMQQRYDALRHKPVRANGEEHQRARQLAQQAQSWSAQEKRATAQAITEWLPKVVVVDIKDERKKLKLASLQGEP